MDNKQDTTRGRYVLVRVIETGELRSEPIGVDGGYASKQLVEDGRAALEEEATTNEAWFRLAGFVARMARAGSEDAKAIHQAMTRWRPSTRPWQDDPVHAPNMGDARRLGFACFGFEGDRCSCGTPVAGFSGWVIHRNGGE